MTRKPSRWAIYFGTRERLRKTLYLATHSLRWWSMTLPAWKARKKWWRRRQMRRKAGLIMKTAHHRARG